MKKHNFICILCKKQCTGYGNNPEPLASTGRCCDVCNMNKVIPARLSEVRAIKGPKTVTRIVSVQNEDNDFMNSHNLSPTLIFRDAIQKLRGNSKIHVEQKEGQITSEPSEPIIDNPEPMTQEKLNDFLAQKVQEALKLRKAERYLKAQKKAMRKPRKGKNER